MPEDRTRGIWLATGHLSIAPVFGVTDVQAGHN